ncbi:uncharacterized protein Ecym_1095 [Eremothecium cymbalariae DBVPG|uniref:Uncharacterized protein n=1 Tax=Eremothecium cymbalariae (strain CBS 270.75 / DBVPG 7215 / KCTC 17166 / NRRL Y-17582) TaxID=931890 RepID=G8JME2_ERECY|nr:hypothetical protein Ecym_1095 [Eremothecium cymbalariae DBVPG\
MSSDKSGYIDLKRYCSKACSLQKRYFPCDRILARRILKCTINSTIALTLCLIPKVRELLGPEPALMPLIAVIVHPGRRTGAIIQSSMYVLTGLVTGLGYSLFARYLAQRCLGSTWSLLSDEQNYIENYDRYEAALAVLAVFEIFMLFFHGWMRAVSHHYFHIVFPLFVVVHFTFLAPLRQSAAEIARTFSIPFYLGIGMSVFWNLIIFPEFGTTYCGKTTVDTLNELHHFLNNAINFFISSDLQEESQSFYEKKPCSLARLVTLKNSINQKVSNCELVLDEGSYELSYSYLGASQLTDIIDKFKPLAMYATGLANACQLEFVLLKRQGRLFEDSESINVDTQKEITHADSKRLLAVLKTLRLPIFALHKTLNESLYISKIVLCDAYDVDFSHSKIPKSFKQESNIMPDLNFKQRLPKDFDFKGTLDKLKEAADAFDREFREQLADVSHELLSPSDEMFLISLFLINFKEIINSVILIMQEAQKIQGLRKERESKGWLRGKSFWFTALSNLENFKKWINRNSRLSGLTESATLQGVINNQSNVRGETATVRPQFEEQQLLRQQTAASVMFDDVDHRLPMSSNSYKQDAGIHSKAWTASFQHRLAAVSLKRICMQLMINMRESFKKNRERFRFGAQVTISLIVASFPMFIPKARHWYVDIRGSWVGFVCILCLEPNVGGTFWVFFLRGVGVIGGAAWAYVSYLAGGQNQQNPYLMVFVTIIGAVPGFYFLLGSAYIKAAIIHVISIYIVLLATVIPTSVGGTIAANFGKRCLAVAYGGGVALVAQTVIFPIKARDQLNDEISFVSGCIADLIMLLATGTERGSKFMISTESFERFSLVSSSAKSALSRADTYKGLARQEPRLKGRYTELEKVFTQIIFIQKQIIDLLDVMVLLRKNCGSILDDLNATIYPYRRQVIGSMVNMMRALQEAIINKTPLPHYLPSARISYRRLVNKVREILDVQYRNRMGVVAEHPNLNSDSDKSSIDSNDDDEGIVLRAKKRPTAQVSSFHAYVVKEKYLGWSATSSAAEEIIEYIEELLQLTKILVGVNEFKYGFLSRPLYSDWAAEAATGFDDFIKGTVSKVQKPSASDRKNFHASGNIRETDIDDHAVSSLEDQSLNVTEAPIQLTNSDDNISVASSRRIISDDTDPSLSKKYWRRAGSIDNESLRLQATKTLGEIESEFEDDTSDSEELPLALKRFVSRKK